MIEFLQRERSGITVVASLAFPGKWRGEPFVRSMIEGMEHRLWGGKFDPTNEAHYEVMPQVICGSRLWAVHVAEEQRTPIEANPIFFLA